MEECFNCAISSEKVRLFDAISKKGIVKICKNCSLELNLPLIKRPTTFQLKESEVEQERGKTVYETLSSIAGLDALEHQEKVERLAKQRNSLKKEEFDLRNLVDKNFKKRFKPDLKPRPDLIDNFHWVIMRARRSKKLTQSKLAQELGESLSAIQMAEQGILPENDYRLINKLEAFLAINLVKKEFVNEIVKKQPIRILEFDPIMTKNLTIEDLRKMKEQKKEKVKKEINNSKEINEEELEVEEEEKLPQD